MKLIDVDIKISNSTFFAFFTFVQLSNSIFIEFFIVVAIFSIRYVNSTSCVLKMTLNAIVQNIYETIDQSNEKNIEKMIEFFSISNIIVSIIDIKISTFTIDTLNIAKVSLSLKLIFDLIFLLIFVSIQISKSTLSLIFHSTFDLTMNLTINSIFNSICINIFINDIDESKNEIIVSNFNK